MKKSNVIIFALLVACSAFLLWLWYFLGFNRVDGPLDLVLSIVWWAVIVVAIVVIVKAEQVRRRRVRTVYVGNRSTFNSEKGLVALAAEKPVQEVVAALLDSLKYDFTREDFPDEEKFQPKYFIRTSEFEVEKRDDQDVADQATEAAAADRQPEPTKWKGEVVVAGTGEERAFDTPEGLTTILAALEAAA